MGGGCGCVGVCVCVFSPTGDQNTLKIKPKKCTFFKWVPFWILFSKNEKKIVLIEKKKVVMWQLNLSQNKDKQAKVVGPLLDP